LNSTNTKSNFHLPNGKSNLHAEDLESVFPVIRLSQCGRLHLARYRLEALLRMVIIVSNKCRSDGRNIKNRCVKNCTRLAGFVKLQYHFFKPVTRLDHAFGAQEIWNIRGGCRTQHRVRRLNAVAKLLCEWKQHKNKSALPQVAVVSAFFKLLCVNDHRCYYCGGDAQYASECLSPRSPFGLSDTKLRDDQAAIVDRISHVTSPVVGGEIVCGGMA